MSRKAALVVLPELEDMVISECVGVLGSLMSRDRITCASYLVYRANFLYNDNSDVKLQSDELWLSFASTSIWGSSVLAPGIAHD